MDTYSIQEGNESSTTAMLFTIKVQGEIFTLSPYLTKQSDQNSGSITYKVKYKVHDSNDQSLSLDRIPEILRDFTDFTQVGPLVNSNSGELLGVSGIEIELEGQDTNTLGEIPDPLNTRL